jgi:hypothetical protein
MNGEKSEAFRANEPNPPGLIERAFGEDPHRIFGANEPDFASRGVPVSSGCQA